ncbi:beta-glucosidase [Penicillium canescens]|nr:beta-glucosidase [Penicillium canescens]
MCSYNRINNSYGRQNTLLISELGFQGFVGSDWHTDSGIPSTAAGLNMVMPDSPLLAAGLSNGSFSLTRLDDIATRILAAWYNYAELEHPQSGMPANLLEPYQSIEARDPASKKTPLPECC